MKILWVKAGGLVPLDIGGKIRSYHILRELSHRHDVTFLTYYAAHPNDRHGELNRVITRVILHPCLSPRRSFGDLAHFASCIFTRQPYQLIRYSPRSVAVVLRHLLTKEKFDVIVCDFLAAAGIIPWNHPCPKVLFAHNVEALIWKRHFEVASNPLWKAICWREYRTTARAERCYLSLSDHVLAVSDADRNSFAQLVEETKISVIPTGVDLEFFRPAAVKEEPNTLVFTGAMDWMPNEDGIFYFVEKILPQIRTRVPKTSLVVVGRNPSARLLRLASTNEGVHVTGRVEDVRPHVQRGSVYIVPLRIGSGTRLKIFEALAMRKAVVSTQVGAEGLPVRSGKNILLADDPEGFANAVVGLLKDDAKRKELGRAARELVVAEYGWGSVAQHFETVLKRIVGADRLAAVAGGS